jgi:hypothetical protein
MSFQRTEPVTQVWAHRNGRVNTTDLKSRAANRASKHQREFEVYALSKADSSKTYSILRGDACFIVTGERQAADALVVISTFNGATVPWSMMRKYRGRNDFERGRAAMGDKYTFVGIAATDIFVNGNGVHQVPQEPVIKIAGITMVHNYTDNPIAAGMWIRVRFPTTPIVNTGNIKGLERDWCKAQYVPFHMTDVFPTPVTLRHNLDLARNSSEHPSESDPTVEEASYHDSIVRMIQNVAFLAVRSWVGRNAPVSMGTVMEIEQFVGIDVGTEPIVMTAEQSETAFNTSKYTGWSTSRALVHAAMGVEHNDLYPEASLPTKHALHNAFTEMFAENEGAIKKALSTVCGQALTTADKGGKFDLIISRSNI